MKQKLNHRIKKKKYYSIVTAVSSGILVIIALSCVCIYCVSKLDIPDKIIRIAIDFVLCCGGFASGFSHGKFKRHKGILCGIICGFWLWMAVTVFGLCAEKMLEINITIFNGIILCVSSVIGGIYGVNSKIRNPPV